ncbi:MAG: class II aldolase/adducin family protein, partial [Sphingomonas sp.]|nr:class II aldolase/adducin family protein [Sphingomonas sp.]
HTMILRNHGTLAVGESVGQCFLRLYFLERACEAQVMMLSAGPGGLNNPPQGVEHKVEQQSAASGMKMLADGLAWPALLRKLDRHNPGYRD